MLLLALVFVAMRIGLICPGHAGHLNPTSRLGAELQRRGHVVTLISTPQGASTAQKNGLDFAPIGIPEFQSGCLDRDLETEGKLSGLSCFRHTIQLFRREEQLILRDLPSVIQRYQIDVLCVDQLLPAAMDVAEAHGLPFGVLCTALPLHLDPSVPPFITTWRPANGSRMHRLRNRMANMAIVALAAPLYTLVNRYRKEHGLRRHRSDDAQNQGLFQVAQIPSFVDFPRKLPSHFFYSQPWHDLHRDQSIPFPWGQLDGRPIVYASLGTVQNRITPTYIAVAESCRDLNVQLILSLGRKGASLPAESLPENVIVVDYAPQLSLLRRAELVITHAGMNTALEALACGIPMVALPVGNDQPGIAARLAELRVAEVVKVKRVNPKKLKKAILKVLKDPRYKEAATRLQRRISHGCPTLEKTAELIEMGLTRSEPLLRDDPEVQRILRHESRPITSMDLDPNPYEGCDKQRMREQSRNGTSLDQKLPLTRAGLLPNILVWWR